MDVNPLILITAGAAVVGAAALVICRKAPADDKEHTTPAAPKKKSPAPVASAPAAAVESTPAAAEVAAPVVKKGKKKVRSNKKKKASAASASEPDDDSEEEPAKPAAKPEVKVAAASAPAPAAQKVEEDDDEEDNFAMYTNKSGPVNNVVKNPKKAKETPEQKAARKERQRQKEAEKANAELILAAAAASDNDLPDLNNFNSPAVQYDGWNVVEVKKPKKKEEEPSSPTEAAAAAPAAAPVVAAAAPEPAAPPAPVIETITTPMTVDSKKLGLLIGPKGVTKIGIQNLTGATIEMPKIEKDAPPAPVTINVTGPAASVSKAMHALNELILKGYCTLLAGDDFQEGYVAIHPRFLPDVIGKGGACIRALQQHTGVKITTPANTTKADGSAASKVKIGLAGPREKVTEARNLIKEITKYYHTSVTHPGVTHIEMDIPANYYNYIIGSKGSEIKHIQNSFKVNVYIPIADSNNSNVLIVGEPANVASAEKHIRKLIEKVDTIAEQKAAAEAATLAFKAANAAARAAAQSAHPAATQSTFVGAGGKPSIARVDKDDEPQEEWMKEFAPRTGGIDFGAILPSGAKLAAAPAATSAAAPAEASASSESS